jgi:16S rRNA processing protein RimM
MEKEKLIQLGECHKVHGIKGGFSFHLFNHEDSILENDSRVLLRPMKNSKLEEAYFSIRSISVGPKKAIVYLEGINDRNQAEEILPFSIWMDRSDFPELSEGYYLSDLIGLEVQDSNSGESLGKISSTYSNGAQDIVIIEDTSGRPSFELPLVEAFFPEVDIASGVVKLNLPEEIE